MSFVKREKQDSESGHSLMCTAHGCPQRWSVSIGNLCSYHAWEEPKFWHGITQRLQQFGPWTLPRGGETETARDMKTRMRGASINNLQQGKTEKR
jgi:hypothetical protein